MKIVFDTNVLISATLWDYSVSHKLLIKLIKKEIQIFSTLEILQEYKDAVMRDFHYSEDKVNEIIAKLSNFLNIVKPEIKFDIIKDDPDDNKILECAIASNSEYILSYDKHLLNLKGFQEIKIIKPEDLII